MEFQTPSSKKNSALTIHSDVAFLFVPMRLLTHNTLRNNSAAAKGKGFPLKITATEIRVDEPNQDNDDREREIAFAKKMLVMLDWSALVQVRFSSKRAPLSCVGDMIMMMMMWVFSLSHTCRRCGLVFFFVS